MPDDVDGEMQSVHNEDVWKETQLQGEYEVFGEMDGMDEMDVRMES
jgi:hypothetical protein